MDEEYLYILDFEDCSLNCIHLKEAIYLPNDFETNEDLIRYWGFNPENCQWMFSSSKLDVIDIVTPLI